MRKLTLLFGFVGFQAVVVFAEPWWTSYEGNAFPEEEGEWQRVHGSVPAQRWIEDGSLFIDSRESVWIYDYYEMVFQHPIDPQHSDETFVLSWGLTVHDTSIYYDTSIGVTSDPAGPYEFYRAAFGFGTDRVWSSYEHTWAPFTPGVFHDFEMRSSDMRTYALYIDGAPVLTGAFTEVYGPSRVSWGDGVQGSTSLTEWDYVRLGVLVPEPALLTSAVILSAFLRGARDGLARTSWPSWIKGEQ
jgi:hypothetical protein